MRTVLPFDTHSYVKRLVAAGMPEPQAEVQAEALAEIVLSHLATKDDLTATRDDLKREMDDLRREIEGLRSDFKQEIEGLGSEFKGEMSGVELRLAAKLEAELRKQMVWFFGMLVVLAGALVTLLRVIPPLR